MITAQEKARLTWRCRRGMLELDLILTDFLAAALEGLTAAELNNLEHLLTYPDPDLYAWFMGYEQPTDPQHYELITRIRTYHQTKSL